MLYKTLKNKTYKVAEGHRIEVRDDGKYLLKTPAGFIYYPSREMFERYLEEGALEGRVDVINERGKLL